MTTTRQNHSTETAPKTGPAGFLSCIARTCGSTNVYATGEYGYACGDCGLRMGE